MTSLLCFISWLWVTAVNINIALGYNSDFPQGILRPGKVFAPNTMTLEEYCLAFLMDAFHSIVFTFFATNYQLF